MTKFSDILVYVGGGTDFEHLLEKRLANTVHAVYIDALPGTPHYLPQHFGYERHRTIETMLEVARQQLDVTNIEMLDKDTAVIFYRINGKVRIITYYFNHAVNSASDIPSDLRKNATILSIKGCECKFTPSSTFEKLRMIIDEQGRSIRCK